MNPISIPIRSTYEVLRDQGSLAWAQGLRFTKIIADCGWRKSCIILGVEGLEGHIAPLMTLADFIGILSGAS